MKTRAFEAIADAVVVTDLQGKIIVVNFAAEAASGFAREELLAMHIGELVADEGSGLRSVVRERVADGEVLQREESWLMTREHGRVAISVSAAPVMEDGVPVALVLVLRDTREMRRLFEERDCEIRRREAAERDLRSALASIEERLEQTRSTLLHAERRATLGTLAGGVGHELRNIAQLQVAAVEMLRDQLPKPTEAIAASLADLDTVTEHITTHARRLLQYAKPGPDHTKPLDIAAAIADVVAMLRGAGKLQQVDVQIEVAPTTVTVNKTRIEQIFVNLLVNAADAIAGRGTITITATRTATRLAISVHDTGPGIDPAILPRIFEPFFTTKAPETGTGLGLPVVKEIVEDYGGTLQVHSAPGTGTTFTFDLPMSSP